MSICCPASSGWQPPPPLTATHCPPPPVGNDVHLARLGRWRDVVVENRHGDHGAGDRRVHRSRELDRERLVGLRARAAVDEHVDVLGRVARGVCERPVARRVVAALIIWRLRRRRCPVDGLPVDGHDVGTGLREQNGNGDEVVGLLGTALRSGGVERGDRGRRRSGKHLSEEDGAENGERHGENQWQLADAGP